MRNHRSANPIRNNILAEDPVRLAATVPLADSQNGSVHDIRVRGNAVTINGETNNKEQKSLRLNIGSCTQHFGGNNCVNRVAAFTKGAGSHFPQIN